MVVLRMCDECLMKSSYSVGSGHHEGLRSDLEPLLGLGPKSGIAIEEGYQKTPEPWTEEQEHVSLPRI